MLSIKPAFTTAVFPYRLHRTPSGRVSWRQKLSTDPAIIGDVMADSWDLWISGPFESLKVLLLLLLRPFLISINTWDGSTSPSIVAS